MDHLYLVVQQLSVTLSNRSTLWQPEFSYSSFKVVLDLQVLLR